MKKITNNTLKKELKKYNNNLYIFIIFISLAALFCALGIFQNKKLNENYTYLNDIIENKSNEENRSVYLNIASIPYSIAKYEGEKNHAFYIVYDGHYFYIAYLSNELYEKLNVEGLEEKPITIYGVTTSIPENVKEIAIEVYNEGLEEDKKITMNDFGSYFGEIYLNNASLKTTNYIFYIIGFILFIVSLYIIFLFIVEKIKVKKVLNSLDEKKLNNIEKEIDKENSSYYKNHNLILTKNYIIITNHNFKILTYKNLIWIYEKRRKEYGITISKKIFVMDKGGNTYNLISTDGTKQNKENIFKDIITKISNKNDKILVGFSKKNEEIINEILKNS